MLFKVDHRPNEKEYCIKSFSNKRLYDEDISDRWAIVPENSNAGHLLSMIPSLHGPEALEQIIVAAIFEPGFVTPCPDCHGDEVPCICSIG